MLENAFIFAAGFGNRMRPLTDHTAKPLLYYRGERLIERHLHRLQAAHFKRVVINCSWQSTQLRQILGDGSQYGLEIIYSCEDNTPLETASGLLRCTELLGESDVLTLNGDVWTDLDLSKLHKQLPRSGIVLVDNPPHNPEGDFSLGADNMVMHRGHQSYTYAGIGIFDRHIIDGANPNGAKLGDCLRAAASKNQLHAYHHKGQWFDVGSPQALICNQGTASN